MNSRLNKNQSRKNSKKIIILKKKQNSPNKFKTMNINSISKYKRHSADLQKTRAYKYFKYNNKRKINSMNIKSQSTIIDRLNKKNSSINIKPKVKYILLNKTNSNKKSSNKSNIPINQKKSQQIYRKIFLKNFSKLNRNRSTNVLNTDKSDTSELNNSNSKTLYKKIFSNGFPHDFFRTKNINKIALKNTLLNNPKRASNFRSSIINSSKNCDASTNTIDQINIKKIIPKMQEIRKYKRPLMVDYLESEHKKFYHGFDKLKGRNRYKIPHFIVYKY